MAGSSKKLNGELTHNTLPTPPFPASLISLDDYSLPPMAADVEVWAFHKCSTQLSGCVASVCLQGWVFFGQLRYVTALTSENISEPSLFQDDFLEESRVQKSAVFKCLESYISERGQWKKITQGGKCSGYQRCGWVLWVSSPFHGLWKDRLSL